MSSAGGLIGVVMDKAPPICLSPEDVGGTVRQVDRLAVDDVVGAVLGADGVSHVVRLDNMHVRHLETAREMHGGLRCEGLGHGLNTPNLTNTLCFYINHAMPQGPTHTRASWRVRGTSIIPPRQPTINQRCKEAAGSQIVDKTE